VIFIQSLVPEHAELHLLLSMLTPLGWLERVPTYKEQIRQLDKKDLALREKLDRAEDEEQRHQILRKLEVIAAQRKKGAELSAELEAAREAE